MKRKRKFLERELKMVPHKIPNGDTQIIVKHNGHRVASMIVEEKNPWRSYLYIYCVYVEEKYRNKGVGTLMLKWAINHCYDKAAKGFDLKVWKNNVSAIKLYQNLGFVITDEYDFAGRAVAAMELNII